MKKAISKRFWADQDIQQLIGRLLQYGVITSSVTVFIGGIFYLYQHGQAAVPNYNVFKGEGEGYTSFSGIVKGIANFQTTELIQLGVLVLIATPILRVACSLFGFVLEKDKLYVFITVIVLSIILFSIFGGLKV